MIRELNQKDVFMKTYGKRPRQKIVAEKGEKKSQGEWRNNVCKQYCFHGFVRVLYDLVLEYEKSQKSELCFYCRSVSPS